MIDSWPQPCGFPGVNPRLAYAVPLLAEPSSKPLLLSLMESYYVAPASLKLLGPSNVSASAAWVAGTTGQMSLLQKVSSDHLLSGSSSLLLLGIPSPLTIPYSLPDPPHTLHI